MPTDNRRVAAYLPKTIDDRLEAFKTERGLKGDSSAIIAILEEFFGVSRATTHLNGSSLNVEAIKDELLGELKSELKGIAAKIKDELLGELKSELKEPEADRPKQLSIPSDQGVDQKPLPESALSNEPDEQITNNESELSSELSSKPLDGSVTWSGIELATRLTTGTTKLSTITSKLSTTKEIEELAKWTQKADPDGLAWQRIGKGKYVPILDDFQGF